MRHSISIGELETRKNMTNKKNFMQTKRDWCQEIVQSLGCSCRQAKMNLSR